MKPSDLMKIIALMAALGTVGIALFKWRKKKARLDATIAILSMTSGLFVLAMPWQIERETKALAAEVDRTLGFSGYMFYDFRGDRMFPDEKPEDYNFIRQVVATGEPFRQQTRDTSDDAYKQIIEAAERFQHGGKECRKVQEIQIFPSKVARGNFTTWCKEDGGVWHRLRNEPDDPSAPIRSYETGPGGFLPDFRLPPGFHFPPSSPAAGADRLSTPGGL